MSGSQSPRQSVAEKNSVPFAGSLLFCFFHLLLRCDILVIMRSIAHVVCIAHLLFPQSPQSADVIMLRCGLSSSRCYLLYYVGIPSVLDKKGKTPEPTLDFGTIDKQIQAELKLLRPAVEAFLKAPELPTWDPPDNFAPDIKKFIKGLQIPTYRNGRPSLLFHKLDECGNEEITKIFGANTDMYVIMIALNFFSCAVVGVSAIHPGREKPGASWRA